MMWYWGGGLHWWGWLLGFIVMVAFWGAVVYAGWYLFTGLSRNSQHPVGPAGSAPPAKQILDERLARGDIDADEYKRLRDLITGADRSAASNGSPGTTAGVQQ